MRGADGIAVCNFFYSCLLFHQNCIINKNSIIVPLMFISQPKWLWVGVLLFGNLRVDSALNIKPLTLGKIISILLAFYFYLSQTFFRFVPVFRTIQFAISGDLSVPIFYWQPIIQFLCRLSRKTGQLLSIADCHRQNVNDKCFLGWIPRSIISWGRLFRGLWAKF